MGLSPQGAPKAGEDKVDPSDSSDSETVVPRRNPTRRFKVSDAYLKAFGGVKAEGLAFLIRDDDLDAQPELLENEFATLQGAKWGEIIRGVHVGGGWIDLLDGYHLRSDVLHDGIRIRVLFEIREQEDLCPDAEVAVPWNTMQYYTVVKPTERG